jgi:beta-glucosidase
MGVKEHGEEFMRQRFEESAVRMLKNIFRLGLFENPYLDIEESKTIVGNADFMKTGYEAQLKSIVMLKNKGQSLPVQKDKKLYIPKRFTPAGMNFLGIPIPEKLDYPVSLDIVKKYFTVTENPDEADIALVFIDGASSGNGYDSEEAKKGGTGYVPVSLQYGPYTARHALDASLAGGDPLEKFTNRTYKGKTSKAINSTDLSMVLDTRKMMKGKPVIVSVHLSNPTVMDEFEKQADGIIVTFGVQDQAVLDMITGATEPSGLLPLQSPSDMETVEIQFEDVPHDMKCHVDSEGNTYDFAFGLNWSGLIEDERTARYKKK